MFMIQVLNQTMASVAQTFFSAAADEKLLTIIILTILPGIELRGSLLYAIANNIPLTKALPIILAINFAIAPMAYIAINLLLETLTSRFKTVRRFYLWKEKSIKKKLRKKVEKYGFLALVTFVALPLPGSGSYSAALAATIFDIDIKRLTLANAIGIVIASAIIIFLAKLLL